MKDQFLPAGSVVVLKEATRPIVIIGFASVEEGSNEVWDYLGCAYPIGVVDPSKNLLFNKEQIDKILFTGYTDEEGNKFLNQLEENIKNIK